MSHAPWKTRDGLWPAALSGLLLCFCYPNAGFSFLAWFALTPLFAVIFSRAAKRRHAVLYAWFAGLVFFFGSLHFMVNVDFAAWPALALLESLFWILLGAAAYEVRRFSSIWVRILYLASAFTAVEFFRAEIPVFAFAHNLLGTSQSLHPAMIQIVSTGGVYFLTFLMAFVNACFVFFFYRISTGPYSAKTGLRWRVLIAAAGVIVFTALFGIFRLQALEKKTVSTLRLSVIQPNIPQAVKWMPMSKREILEITSNLTKIAALREPDLIFWPEASFPGFLNADYEADSIKELIQSIHTPVLIGAPFWQSRTEIFNSAYLIDKNGALTARYDKIKLVPFGEYIPLGPMLNWLAPLAYTMGVGDFTPGTAIKTLEWEKPYPFAILICFEDVFQNFTRLAAKNAAFLAVITNDAWFGRTGAPWQHMQASIVRAVENGLPVVRASNSGVSGFISAEGKVLNVFRKNGKDLFTAGELTFELPMARHRTLFSRGGWLFPYGCIIFLFTVLFFMTREPERA